MSTLPFNPAAPATTTESLQVGMVRREDTDEVLEVASWIPSQTVGQLHALRPDMRQGREDSRFFCFCCGHPVLLKKHANGGHYFAHKEKTAADRAGCLYQEAFALSLAEIDRLRFHGQREGARHKRTKDLIANILRADARFSEPELEQRWTSFAEGWRKPDVATSWNGLRVVFEAQVSNTYPQVVAERTEFYRSQGALLIWIFDQLPDSGWRTLHADAFCANHQHLFVVDDEAVSVSQATGVAQFRVYSLRPEVEAYKRPEDDRTILLPTFVESYELVSFADLALNIPRQTASLFSVKEEERRVRHKHLCAAAQADSSHAALRDDINALIQRKASIPAKNLEGWAALICAIEAVRLGVPVGTKLGNPAGVLNMVHDHHPHFFPHLVATLERLGLDPVEKRTGAWKMRTAEFRAGRYCGGPLPVPHARSEELLQWLYPG